MSLPVSNDCVTVLAQRVIAQWPIGSWKDSKVVVAVSGGPDSVALLRLLTRIARENSVDNNFVVAHCNHQTSELSDLDERFVKSLADHLGLDFVSVQREKTLVDDHEFKFESEEVLRDFRYQALIESAHRIGARYIVTGHTWDDQVETILFRLCRGTGILGLSGILPLRVTDGITVIRPMLGIRREEILELLKELGQPFRQDPSNDSSRYSRNFLRNEVIPFVEAKFGNQFRDSLSRIGSQSAEYKQFLDLNAADFVESLDANQQKLDVSRLCHQHDVVIRHAIKQVWRKFKFPEKEMTRQKWMAVCSLIKSPKDGTLQLPGHVTVRKFGSEVCFETTQTNRRPAKDASD